MYVFLEWSFTALMMLSFPLYNSSTIPIFHLPLCLSSPFINARSPIAISICLWLFYIGILRLSLREHKDSLLHLLQVASLQCLIYRCRFFITFSLSSNHHLLVVLVSECLVSIPESEYRHLYTSAVDCLSLSLCPVWLLLVLALWVLLSHLLYINIALLALPSFRTSHPTMGPCLNWTFILLVPSIKILAFLIFVNSLNPIWSFLKCFSII